MGRQNIQSKEWADTGGKSDPGAVKVALGYIDEKPPFQFENWKTNRADQQLAHLEEYGMIVYDAITVYNINSYTLGPDGIIYKSLQNANQGNNPLASPSWWTKAFMDRLTNETIAGIKTFNALKLGGNQDANNKKIIMLSTPTSNQDAANKAYVDEDHPPYTGGESHTDGSGLITKMGLKSGTGDQTITFATPFPNAGISLTLTEVVILLGTAGDRNSSVSSLTTSQATIWINPTDTSGCLWIAKGW